MAPLSYSPPGISLIMIYSFKSDSLESWYQQNAEATRAQSDWMGMAVQTLLWTIGVSDSLNCQTFRKHVLTRIPPRLAHPIDIVVGHQHQPPLRPSRSCHREHYINHSVRIHSLSLPQPPPFLPKAPEQNSGSMAPGPRPMLAHIFRDHEVWGSRGNCSISFRCTPFWIFTFYQRYHHLDDAAAAAIVRCLHYIRCPEANLRTKWILHALQVQYSQPEWAIERPQLGPSFCFSIRNVKFQDASTNPSSSIAPVHCSIRSVRDCSSSSMLVGAVCVGCSV